MSLAIRDGANIALLCRRFGVSRQTGYKWIGRFARGGAAALADRSRRPRRSPAKSPGGVEDAVAAVRAGHPAWGPRKIRRVLIDRGVAGGPAAPAASTVGRILLRRGLVDPGASADRRPFVRFERAHPNELWQMDFKGHFPMLDGARCHPLTVLDDHSRFSLCLRACGDERSETVRGALAELFGRYGQPARVLCDNGGPWGGGGPEPYTQLGVWLVLHGVAVSHGRPRHPQTQGKDERFHRTIDDELLRYHHLRDLADAGRHFDAFRHCYNHDRPHEALGLATPASRWRPSEREYWPDPPPPQYRPGDLVRKVDAAGKLSLHGREFRVGKPFAGHRLGLRPTESDGVMAVLLGDVEVGHIDLRDGSPRLRRPAPPPLATLPAPGPGTGVEQSVNHVPGQLSTLTPV